MNDERTPIYPTLDHDTSIMTWERLRIVADDYPVMDSNYSGPYHAARVRALLDMSALQLPQHWSSAAHSAVLSRINSAI